MSRRLTDKSRENFIRQSDNAVCGRERITTILGLRNSQIFLISGEHSCPFRRLSLAAGIVMENYEHQVQVSNPSDLS